MMPSKQQKSTLDACQAEYEKLFQSSTKWSQ